MCPTDINNINPAFLFLRQPFIFCQKVRITYNGMKGRPEFMCHARQKSTFLYTGTFSLHLCRLKIPFNLDTNGNFILQSGINPF